jgi:hypothetical protein
MIKVSTVMAFVGFIFSVSALAGGAGHAPANRSSDISVIAHGTNPSTTMDIFYTGWKYQWDSKSEECSEATTYNADAHLLYDNSQFRSATKTKKISASNCRAFRIGELVKQKLGASCTPNEMTLKNVSTDKLTDQVTAGIDANCVCTADEQYEHFWSGTASLITHPLQTIFNGPHVVSWAETRSVSAEQCAGLIQDSAGQKAVREAYLEIAN